LPGALADSERRGRRPVAGSTEPCPLAQSVRLAAVVEVVSFNGTETTRPALAREQFINLDARVDPTVAHPENGREIRLKARVEWASGDPNRRPITAQTIYWYVTAGAGNRTGLAGNELPALSGGTAPAAPAPAAPAPAAAAAAPAAPAPAPAPAPAAAAPAPAAPPPPRTVTTTDGQGWTPVVTLRLSTYGGDQFTVYATTDPGYTGGRPAGAYTVWRKFWYQATGMQRPAPATTWFTVPAAAFANFASAYELVFARFEQEAAGPTGPTTVAHRDNLRDHTARGNHVNPVFANNDKVPYKCHIAGIDYASDIGDKNLSDTMRAGTAQTAWVKLWDRGTGSQPWKVSARYRRGSFIWYCNRVHPACPGHNSPSDRCRQESGARWKCRSNTCPQTHGQAEDNCASGPWPCSRVTPPCPTHGARTDAPCQSPAGATWTCNAVGCPGHPRRSDVCGGGVAWQNLPDAALGTAEAHPTQPGWKRIPINLSTITPVPSATDPVQYELVVREYGPTYGWGGGSTLVSVCVGCVEGLELAANQVTLITDILVHEIGHALGLLNLPPAGGSAHDAWKDPDASHGRHCARPTTQCIMWYTADTSTTTAFHLDAPGNTGCHDYLRRQEFARGNMAHWRP
jgi:hypothetical protein